VANPLGIGQAEGGGDVDYRASLVARPFGAARGMSWTTFAEFSGRGRTPGSMVVPFEGVDRPSGLQLLRLELTSGLRLLGRPFQPSNWRHRHLSSAQKCVLWPTSASDQLDEPRRLWRRIGRQRRAQYPAAHLVLA
jgi:hypothetical protein